MFFPEKIKSIKPTDKVLEIGPGGHPHPRSDMLLEKRFSDEKEAEAQRGYTPSPKTDKKVVYYDGGNFPFKDNEFNYVICSHVLEHVQDIDFFVNELNRVASRGYLEYPTIYYDYIYNFPEHVMFLFMKRGSIYYMSKEQSGLNQFLPVNRFFYETLKSGYKSIITELKPYFFQGFEWSEKIKIKKAGSLSDLTYDMSQLNFQKKVNSDRHKILLSHLKGFVKRLITL